MNISIPAPLAQQLQQRVSASKEFDSVEAYVTYVLQEVMKQTGSAPAPAAPYSQDQEEEVKKRLGDLGYLD